jgi:hypothetical protein
MAKEGLQLPIKDYRTGDLFKKTTILGYFLKLPLSLGILYVVCSFFWHNKRIFASIGLAWMLLYLFQLYVYFGDLRHAGFYFIAFLSFWILSGFEPKLWIRWVLGIQVFVSLVFSVLSICHPFAQASTAAKYMISQGVNEEKMVFTNDYGNLPSISSTLHKGIYVTGDTLPQTYVLWEKMTVLSLKASIQDFGQRFQKGNWNVGFIVLTDPVKPDTIQKLLPNYKTEYHEFEGSMSGENFYVVTVWKPLD